MDDHPLERACSKAGGGGLKWNSRLSPPPQGDLHRDQDESLLRPWSHEKSRGKSKAYVCEESKLVFVLR